VARIASICLTAGLMLVLGCQGNVKPQEGTRKPLITVVLSKKMTIPIVADPIGTTRALRDVTIRARVKGFLEQKFFEEGKDVKEGQVLLVIEKRPYQVRLELAKAELASAEAVLKKAKASRANLVSRARLALDQAQLRLDEIEERRERTLLARKAVSQEDFDKADAQRKKSVAQVDADQASLEQSEADVVIDIENARSEVERAHSSVDDAALNLEYCTMRAPFAGRIGELKVKLGNLVGDGNATELVTIEQLDPMGLDLRPAARYLPYAAAIAPMGVAVNVVIEGERPHPHPGRTLFVDNRVDTSLGTFLARAEVPNPEGTILPGQYVHATLEVGQYVDAVVVPEQAVTERQDGMRVLVVESSGKVLAQAVSAVDVYQGLSVLETGLQEGQRVIVDGIQMARPGQFVEFQEVPLEKYRRPRALEFNVDRRYESKVSRMVGQPPRPTGEKPAPKQQPEADKRPAPSQSAPVPTKKER
jgi:multidrug efflux pump subunit AcrA (membrane-fusion protein)